MPSDPTPNPRPVPDFGAIRSTLATDPDMVELISMFVDELPQRTATLQSLVEQRDLAQLKRMAHQLKGAAGGYGFADLGTSAASLERVLLNVCPPPCEEELKRVRERVDELVDLCRRASVG